MMGDDQAELKSAGRVARLLEEQFIIDGWSKGRSYGFEAELAQRYGVGRAAAREAVRILEARGVARMRRGRYGGLELTQPPLEVLYSGIGTYCYLHSVTRAQVRAARQLLDRVVGYLAAEQGREDGLRMLADQPLPVEQKVRAARQCLRTAVNNVVLDLFSTCLDHVEGMDLPEGGDTEGAIGAYTDVPSPLEEILRALADDIEAGHVRRAAQHAGLLPPPDHHHASVVIDPQAKAAPQRTRAAAIVSDLLRKVGPAHWREGYLLGNEAELCERYGVDRRLLRQAIRILEASEAAVSLPGRGQGLMARTPGPASLSRLLCCHFAAAGVDHHQAFGVFRWLIVEAMSLAAREATHDRVLPIQAALAAIPLKPGPEVLEQLALIENQQLALMNNPLIEIFVRSARAFPSWSVALDMQPSVAEAVRILYECCIELTRAMQAREPLAAAAAQERKFVLLWRKLQQRLADDRTIAASSEMQRRLESLAFVNAAGEAPSAK